MNSAFHRAVVAFAYCLLPVASQVCWGWGFTAHKMVTDRAIRLLPTAMQDFYSANKEVLAELCVQADLRRNVDPNEVPYHYIDLEHYEGDLPVLYDDAVRRFGKDKIQASGGLPWLVPKVYADFVAALKRRDYPAVIRLSGDLSHYVGDAHVPLHATENYDGQMTADTGVHARLESRLIELFPELFVFEPSPAALIPDVPGRLWSIIRTSNATVPSVLRDDRRNAYPDRDADGYSIARARDNHGPLMAKRLNDSAHEVASVWYTAWVEAGRPALPSANFAALVKPPSNPSGGALYYDGRYTQPLPMAWPLDVRTAFARVSDFLRLETTVRVAKVNWVIVKGRLTIRVNVLESAAPLDTGKVHAALERLLYNARVKFDGWDE